MIKKYHVFSNNMQITQRAEQEKEVEKLILYAGYVETQNKGPEAACIFHAFTEKED